MKVRRLLGWFVGVSMALSVVVAGCGPAPVSSATLESTSASPEQVVESFYAWYLDDAGNVLSGGAYRSSGHLTGEFTRKVDEIVASFDRGGYDPFLCAQDVPAHFTVDEPVVSDEDATVVVHEIWNPGTEYESVHDVEVVLQMADGVWKIADIVCVAPEAVAMPPEAVVRGFYDWYLGYIGDPATMEIRNPLVDGAYRPSAYLTEEFVQKVDEIVASFDKGGYDPFLCAQDIPGSFTADAAVGSGEEAIVVVHEIWNLGTEFESVLDIAVTLRMVDGVWKIDDVACSVPDLVSPMPEGPIPVTPQGAVAGFYSWYLWYARNVGNVLADETYRQSEYLAEEFVQEVSEIVASFEKGGYDPFLCAQDIPESFTVDTPMVSGGEASLVVRTSFESHAFTVELQEIGGRWAISGVVCEPTGAQPSPPGHLTR